MNCSELHILLVDDDKDVLKIFRLMLERLKYRVITATSGLEALSLFQLQPTFFDLVISDINMPKMDGITLTKRIKAIRSDIPIILCTGNITLSNEKLKTAQRLSTLLPKPLTINKMKNVIETVFRSAG